MMLPRSGTALQGAPEQSTFLVSWGLEPRQRPRPREVFTNPHHRVFEWVVDYTRSTTIFFYPPPLRTYVPVHIFWFFPWCLPCLPHRYWNICLVTRLPGFAPVVRLMRLEDVESVERVKTFVGYTVQIQERPPRTRTSTPLSSSSSVAAATASASASTAAGLAVTLPGLDPAGGAGVAGGFEDNRGVPGGGAAVATSRRRPASKAEVLTFFPTAVNAVELRELIVALVRVHTEPVEAPSSSPHPGSEYHQGLQGPSRTGIMG
ncbi:unnamed protein product, partial [Discosporangium mesarthrocarpum]